MRLPVLLLQGAEAWKRAERGHTPKMKGHVQSRFSRILLVLHREEGMAYSSEDFTFQLPSVIRGHHIYKSVS